MIDQDENCLRALRVSVRRTHIDSALDPDVDAAMAYITQNIKDFEAGAASPRRGYFIAGPAGTGKTTALKRAFAKVPEFQPCQGEYGEIVYPLISVKLPKKCATLDMVVEILKAMNLPHEGKERDLTPFMLEQFKRRGTKVLHLDELQHTVRSNTRGAFEAAQDLLKQLMDRDDWALHVICSGIPKIERMREDKQIKRRSKVIPFHLMEYPEDSGWIEKLVNTIAVQGCGLSLKPELEDAEFHERLHKAAGGAWGTTIEMIQASCFRALAKGKAVLTIKHFGQEYEEASGSSRGENIFMSPRFREIEPTMSLASMMEH